MDRSTRRLGAEEHANEILGNGTSSTAVNTSWLDDLQQRGDEFVGDINIEPVIGIVAGSGCLLVPLRKCV